MRDERCFSFNLASYLSSYADLTAHQRAADASLIKEFMTGVGFYHLYLTALERALAAAGDLSVVT
jgi:hypothetical protein